MTSPENNQEQISQAAIDEILANPAFQAALKFAVAQNVIDTSANFVLDYDNLSEDDARYLNRDETIREVADHRNFDAARNIESIIPENETTKHKVSPYSSLVLDISEAESAGDKTKVDSLTDELAARLTIMPVDYSVKNANADDARQEQLIYLQKRGLSNDELSVVIDKIDEYDQLIVAVENELDEVLLNDMRSQIDTLVENNRKPMELLFDKDGNPTKEHIDIVGKLKRIIEKIEEPTIKQQVMADTQKEMRRHIRVGEEMLAEKNPVVNTGNAKPAPKTGNLNRPLSTKEQQEKARLEAEKEAEIIEKQAKQVLKQLKDIHEKAETTNGEGVGKEAVLNAIDRSAEMSASKYYEGKDVRTAINFKETLGAKVLDRVAEMYLEEFVYTDSNMDEVKRSELIKKDLAPIHAIYKDVEDKLREDIANSQDPTDPKKPGVLKRLSNAMWSVRLKALNRK